MTDRSSPLYNPNFDIDFALGQQGELFIRNIATSLANRDGRVEVKTDERALETGNLFIEYECQKFAGWSKSGIATTEADYWAFVIGSDSALVAPTWRVKAAARRLHRASEVFRAECKRGSHPTRGVKVRLDRVWRDLFHPDNEAPS